MLVSIHQPAYLPWMGYIDKIARSDVFIYLDTVQFQKGSFQNRNRILTANGPQWLTVPVETKGKLFDVPLKDLPIAAKQNWQRKHAAAIVQAYGKAPEFARLWPELVPYYSQPWDRLSDLCFAMLQTLLRLTGITSTRIIKASEMGTIEGQKGDLVLSLCQAVGATSYLSGSLGRDYVDLDDFATAGIDVRFQDYAHPVYPQKQDGFTPAMGLVDLLFNVPDPGAYFVPGPQKPVLEPQP